jgi:hypothetical protein
VTTSTRGLPDGEPCAILFEWDCSVIDGFGIGHALPVGDNTGCAGITFAL